MKNKFILSIVTFLTVFAVVALPMPSSAQDAPTEVNPFTRGLVGTGPEEGVRAGLPESYTQERNTILLVMKFIRIALSFLGVATIGLVAYAGFLWMTAGGNDEQLTTAKKTLRNGVIGLILITSAYSISWFVIQQIQLSTGATGSGTLETDIQALFD